MGGPVVPMPRLTYSWLSAFSYHPLTKGVSGRTRARPRLSAGWLWEKRSAIVARVRDRNSMEVADDLGHRFWRLLMCGRPSARNVNASNANRKKNLVPGGVAGHETLGLLRIAFAGITSQHQGKGRQVGSAQ